MKSEEALALSQGYTDNSILGITGALAGKNCTIKSVVDNVVTFEWTADDGTKRTSTMTANATVPEVMVEEKVEEYIEDHKDELSGGVQVIENSSETIHDNTVLVFDVNELLSDGDKEAKLTQQLVATQEIGSVTFGKTYPVGTDLEAILRDILIKEEAPLVALTLNPTTPLYDVVSETVSTIVLSATVTKKTYAPKTVKYYVDDVLVNTKTITDGGTYSYTHTFSPSTNTNHTFKVVASDGKLSSSATKTIKFVGNTYYGIVASDIGTPTDAQVKALSKKLKDVKGYTWEGITTDFGKVVYAYPSSFGALTSIKDPINNFTYTDSFSRATVTIDGISYYVYTQSVASASDNVKLVFA